MTHIQRDIVWLCAGVKVEVDQTVREVKGPVYFRLSTTLELLEL